MPKPKLRILSTTGEHEPTNPQANVPVKFRDIFPLLMYAHRHDCTWLRDFADDDVVVTQDLADILSQFANVLQSRKGA
ncbi:hypothetical protein Pan216_05200 [Planctomycetes bacterium Pan216]|uniref:Uncharacterized protein n=1 Tax=Kolteria novifilia TaxID=2527975 RepID=A0A518AY81_9BACT|nr:hypothetical protein Pan216_05200 [Planctomycetes bacterium Pan216]